MSSNISNVSKNSIKAYYILAAESYIKVRKNWRRQQYIIVQNYQVAGTGKLYSI